MNSNLMLNNSSRITFRIFLKILMLHYIMSKNHLYNVLAFSSYGNKSRSMIKALQNLSSTHNNRGSSLMLRRKRHHSFSLLKKNRKQTDSLNIMKRNLSGSNLDDIDFDKEGFSFQLDSFDKKGQWMTINWAKKKLPKTTISNADIALTDPDLCISTFSPDSPSPIQLGLVRDRMVYIKRDDLLHLHDSNVSGNKARKFFALNELPVEDFPDALVSYGGPQSNAMLALAAIVNAKNVKLTGVKVEEEISDEIETDNWLHSDDDEEIGEEGDLENDDDVEDFQGYVSEEIKSLKNRKRFVYYTKKLPRYLRKQPSGNLLRALSLGMEIKELSNDEYKELFGGEDGGSSTPPSAIDAPVPMSSLWLPQGGACGVAKHGAVLMAEEIISFWESRGNNMPLTVCLPGGTCTTAMLLSQQINVILEERARKDENCMPLDIKVGVIPCVGDEQYALRQMKALDIATGGSGTDIPLVFPPWKNKYLRFGEPNIHILNTFLEMKNEYGIYLDLLYGAPAWNLLLQYLTSQRDSPIKGRQVMYIHSGGIEGVASQLTRYKHKGLIDESQLQTIC